MIHVDFHFSHSQSKGWAAQFKASTEAEFGEKVKSYYSLLLILPSLLHVAMHSKWGVIPMKRGKITYDIRSLNAVDDRWKGWIEHQLDGICSTYPTIWLTVKISPLLINGGQIRYDLSNQKGVSIKLLEGEKEIAKLVDRDVPWREIPQVLGTFVESQFNGTLILIQELDIQIGNGAEVHESTLRWLLEPYVLKTTVVEE